MQRPVSLFNRIQGIPEQLSPYEENILDFVYIAETQPALFTAVDRADLEDLLIKLPDNVEQISDEIAIWCEAHPQILYAILNLPVKESANIRGSEVRKPYLTSQEVKEILGSTLELMVSNQAYESVLENKETPNSACSIDTDRDNKNNLLESMAEPVKLSEVNRLVDILAKLAATAFVTPQQFFNDLLSRTNLPQSWTGKLTGVWSGDPSHDARKLIKWAIPKGINPGDTRFTTLGSILQALLQDVGFEDATTIVALIVIYQLYLDKHLLENLQVRYQIPQLASTTVVTTSDLGPDIDWKGPTEEVELQSWFKPAPDFQDVGFLKLAIERATSVCRIDIPEKGRTGTGFLIAPSLVLTNYHVLKKENTEDIETNARDALLRFGYYTADEGKESEVQTFRLNPNKPVLKSSLINDLDYVLLKVEDSVKYAKNIKPAPYELTSPSVGNGLSILQHPEGATMKVAISKDGVTGVYKNERRIQYVTRASAGSSGSPCFNEDWKVVALHQAQRSKTFGTIRQGILFSLIYEEIKDYL